MSEHRPIDDYLNRLRAWLRGRDREDAIAELRDHLLESVEGLREQGLDTHDAELLALARLGEVEGLARSYGARRWTRRRLGAAAAAACALAIAALTGAAALHPVGNDGDLARRLGIEPRGLQEPSRIEINGVPLPRDVSPTDQEMVWLRWRLDVLDG
jgi:hypothetical protein